MLLDNSRKEEKDKHFELDLHGAKCSHYLFVRVSAKNRRFTNVDFRYTIFDTCYLSNCAFDSCDFTGCRFLSTNFHGSSFMGCKFDYSYFEKTQIDDFILKTECPSVENLKMRFARTLRVNFQQLGLAESVNRAIIVELSATNTHLYNAWHSNGSYYRKKYRGIKRISMFVEWAKFKLLDYVWGNGESLVKLLRAIMFVLVFISLNDTIQFKDALNLCDYFESICASFSIFLGTSHPPYYSESYLAFITLTRLIAFALFVAITTKRLNRR